MIISSQAHLLEAGLGALGAPRRVSASLGELTEMLDLSGRSCYRGESKRSITRKGGVHLSRFERSRLYHVHRAESTRRIEHSSRSRSARAPPPSPRATRRRVRPFACARLPAAPPSRAKRPARPAAPRPAVERALGPLRPRGTSTRSAPPRATGVLSARAGATPRPAAHDSRAERPRRPPRARRLPTYSYRQTVPLRRGQKKGGAPKLGCCCCSSSWPSWSSAP